MDLECAIILLPLEALVGRQLCVLIRIVDECSGVANLRELATGRPEGRDSGFGGWKVT